MAENPNDKALREKLLSAEYAYDPGAWAAMEQLMERKKKRGLLWWWLSSGAVAVALLVSAGVYIYTSYTGQDAHSSRVMAAVSSSQQASEPNGTTLYPANSGEARNNLTVPAAQSASISKFSITAESKKVTKTQANNTVDQFIPFEKSHKRQTKTTRQGNKRSGAVAATNGNLAEGTSVPVLNAEDILYPTSLELLNQTEERTISGKEEDAQTIPARHKHHIALSYSLGVESGAFVSYAHKTFSGTPTWSTGISQQFNISKYFAITNSILYSEVNFKINNPAYPANQYNDLNSYQSKIKELAIPIGIKVYPYSSRHIRISAGVSYVQHIKLNEAFSYQLTPKAPPATMTPIATADFPVNNSFQPENSVESLTNFGSQIPNGKLMEYYSLGNGQRYYGGMMYTVGIDILLPHRISISAEPAMRMSIGKIRMQNSRAFDIGMNAGLKYTF